MIGLAYRGTSNNAAIQKLLHFAVTDVSNDVSGTCSSLAGVYVGLRLFGGRGGIRKLLHFAVTDLPRIAGFGA